MCEWTANQRRLVRITKEYFGLFSAMGQRGHEPPKTETIDTYRKFQDWCEAYYDDPDIGDNPHQKSNHGVTVKRV
ncbi:hypothetical protein FDZ73_19050 [bacterium]|nr:MAG: hypothetical protein FDZ73_19050 [bacterium]